MNTYSLPDKINVCQRVFLYLNHPLLKACCYPFLRNNLSPNEQ